MNVEQDIQESLRVLKSGGIILYPTDTIWGIGCDATNEKAVEKIYSLKQRPEEKAMIVLLAAERDLISYVSALDIEVFNYLETIQKPTTIIYQGAIGLAPNIINKDGSIAIRIVKEEFCKHLIKRLGKPLVSTSANFSGKPSPIVFKDIDPLLSKHVDYCVNYRQNEATQSQPSSIVKWNKDRTVTVIRP
ncbi:MAG: L-threonylcarbamoyladenylate synthase [Chitinophagaceae bacterium]